MKKIILLLLFLTSWQLNAQELVGYEYFFNNDPGVGLGTYVAITPSENYSATINIPTTGLPTGLNLVCIRFKDTLDNWSVVQSYSFIKETGNNNSPEQLVGYEYFFNADPGIGNGHYVSIGTPITNFGDTISLNTSNVPLGLNLVGLRFKDNRGLWGSTQSFSFINDSGDGNTDKINAIEVFFDEEPGVGNGIFVPINSTASLDQTINVPISDSLSQVSDSQRVIYVRARNSAGLWSSYVIDTTTLTYLIDTSTGVSNIQTQGFKFYPNPTRGTIYLIVENSSTGFFSFEIFDITGKALLRKTLKKESEKQTFEINCTGFNPGSYLIHIQDLKGDFNGNAKLIIQ